MTISTEPLTGINQVSNYFQTPLSGSGTLSAPSIKFGSPTFNLASKTNDSNPLARFTSGVLDGVTYAGLATNGDGVSLMVSSKFVYRRRWIGWNIGC
jgi:hypothetical protein